MAQAEEDADERPIGPKICPVCSEEYWNSENHPCITDILEQIRKEEEGEEQDEPLNDWGRLAEWEEGWEEYWHEEEEY